ncbi:MAG: UbiA family prenyltransferase [Pyrinomonadaceae bacterium]|nr:UbiA family prenyltransferase [Pyrinomonadaceae bacterium]
MKTQQLKNNADLNWRIYHESQWGLGKALNVKVAWSNYLRLIRFHFHITFISVPLGALFITNGVTVSLIESLFLLYVSFNILLYGGIYTINGIADIKSDEKHPSKRKRPLPSREISVKSAIAFSAVLLASGLSSGLLLFNSSVFYMYLAFLAVNIFYNLIAREIPYLEIIVNCVTHPLRFLMGVLLVNGKVPYLLLSAIFFMALGLVGVRRSLEKDVRGWEARKTLESYSDRRLLLLKLSACFAILLVMVADASISRAFYVATLTLYLALAFGPDFSSTLRRSLVTVWTR